MSENYKGDPEVLACCKKLGITERTFYAKTLDEQRRLLGLRFGRNPGRPSYFTMPAGVNVPEVPR